MTTWEYMVREFDVSTPDKLLLMEEFLNVSGQDGWELIAVTSKPTAERTHVVYLKRGRVSEVVSDTAAIDGG